MPPKQYTTHTPDFPSRPNGLRGDFPLQADAIAHELYEIRKLHKKRLRQEKENTALLRFMCMAMLRIHEHEGVLGVDYATLSAMTLGLEPRNRKKKKQIPPLSWPSLYDGR